MNSGFLAESFSEFVSSELPERKREKLAGSPYRWHDES